MAIMDCVAIAKSVESIRDLIEAIDRCFYWNNASRMEVSRELEKKDKVKLGSWETLSWHSESESQPRNLMAPHQATTF